MTLPALTIGLNIGTGSTGGGTPAPPAGFVYIVDADGAYLKDADGAYLMEHA